jgi:hypothetical protein
MIRSYFTKNISWYIDHPDTLTQDDIIKILEDDTTWESYHSNNIKVYIHKSHTPKYLQNDEESLLVKQGYKTRKLFWKGLWSLFRDLFR